MKDLRAIVFTTPISALKPVVVCPTASGPAEVNTTIWSEAPRRGGWTLRECQQGCGRYGTCSCIAEQRATREELSSAVAISPQAAANDSHSPGMARLPVTWIR